jgi:hypothetical protein
VFEDEVDEEELDVVENIFSGKYSKSGRKIEEKEF